MKINNICAEHYFYPLISSIPPYRELPSANPANLTMAAQVSDSVICLPIYPDQGAEIIYHICKLITSV